MANESYSALSAHVLVVRRGAMAREIELYVGMTSTREEALRLVRAEVGDEVLVEHHGKPLPSAVASALDLHESEVRKL